MKKILTKFFIEYDRIGRFLISGVFGSFALIGPMGMGLLLNPYFLLLYFLSPLLMRCAHLIAPESSLF